MNFEQSSHTIQAVDFQSYRNLLVDKHIDLYNHLMAYADK